MASRICGLFSGIGGFELGFERAGFESVLMCESDATARAVLSRHFPNVPLRRDVTKMKSLPSCEVLLAGWPCQDLSQAGRTAGIQGDHSGLIGEVFRLLDGARRKPDYVVLENVAFSLHLHGGRALKYVTRQFEELGYAWAYRILDSRNFGLPQRRRRLFVVASRTCDPAALLFDGCEEELSDPDNASMTGFYWTEGNTGIGWSPGAIPPLKGGSGLSIPSPPAIWHKSTSSFFIPGIDDAERIQGFRPGWSRLGDTRSENGRVRWRLVGNAVSVPVAAWIAKRILKGSSSQFDENKSKKKPNSATGAPRKRARYFHAVEAVRASKRINLDDFPLRSPSPLSLRAARGFYDRITNSNLRTDPAFIRDLAQYIN